MRSTTVWIFLLMVERRQSYRVLNFPNYSRNLTVEVTLWLWGTSYTIFENCHRGPLTREKREPSSSCWNSLMHAKNTCVYVNLHIHKHTLMPKSRYAPANTVKSWLQTAINISIKQSILQLLSILTSLLPLFVHQSQLVLWTCIFRIPCLK